MEYGWVVFFCIVGGVTPFLLIEWLAPPAPNYDKDGFEKHGR